MKAEAELSTGQLSADRAGEGQSEQRTPFWFLLFLAAANHMANEKLCQMQLQGSVWSLLLMSQSADMVAAGHLAAQMR